MRGTPGSSWRTKRDAMQNYDEMARSYDLQYGEEQEAKFRAALKHIKLEDGCVVLDLGSGTGLLIPHILESVGFLVELDISMGMLRKAREKFPDHPCVDFVHADADHAPFRNSSFDAVFAITLLQNMPNPTQTLREAARLSKGGAALAVTGLKKTFNLKCFLKILNSAGLREKILITNDRIKDYIAVTTSGS